jgi:hypothetical protein
VLLLNSVFRWNVCMLKFFLACLYAFIDNVSSTFVMTVQFFVYTTNSNQKCNGFNTMTKTRKSNYILFFPVTFNVFLSIRKNILHFSFSSNSYENSMPNIFVGFFLLKIKRKKNKSTWWERTEKLDKTCVRRRVYKCQYSDSVGNFECWAKHLHISSGRMS